MSILWLIVAVAGVAAWSIVFPQSFRQVAAIVGAFWRTGNRWARWAIAFIVLWPMVFLALVLWGIGSFTPVLAFMPMMASLFALLAWLDPLVLAALAAIPKAGPLTLRAFSTALGAELLLGIYFASIDAPEGIPAVLTILVLALWATIFLRLGVQGKVSKWLVSTMIVIITLTVIASYFPGIFRAAGIARTRTSSGIEQCVSRGGGFFSCLLKGGSLTVTAPARVAEPKTIKWQFEAQYSAPPDRWSDDHPTPNGRFKLVAARGEKAEALYSNGAYDMVDSYDQVDKSGEGAVGSTFRVRGIGKEVTVFVYTVK